MGGKALSNTKVVRINLDTLNQLKKDIYTKISNTIQIDYLIENPDKTDFGDLDILYTLNPDSKIIIREFIIQTFNPVEIVLSGDVISFAYSLPTGEFIQVDFIKCPDLHMAKFYFSYGDLGNILGQITKYYNVRFGHFGLFIDITKETCIGYNPNINPDKLGLDLVEQIYLINEPTKICEFFQWDYSIWGKFSSELEIFNWISSSVYFNPKIFDYLNHEGRHKVLTRPMFNRFIQWVGTNKTYHFVSKCMICMFGIRQIDCKVQIEKKDRRLEAIEYFGSGSKLDNLIKINQIKQERKNKFNGIKILNLNILGAEKELGEFIKKFRIYIISKYGNWDIWLDSSSYEQVDQEILFFYNLKFLI